jgi:general secretion pathway protein I
MRVRPARLKSRGTQPSGRRARRSPPRGMTLVEVLVAIVILGASVAGLMAAVTMGLRNQQRGEARAAALWLAQQKLNEVDLIGAHVWMLVRPMSGEEEVAGQAYQWTLKIEQQPVGELFTVSVKVEGPGKGGGAELETWINDYAAKGAEGGEKAGAGRERGNAGK